MMPSFEEAVEKLSARLSDGAFAHSMRVADMAVLLGRLYGVDEAAARMAGLLHDWDRELSHEQLCSEANRLGLDVTSADEAVPYLLHARTAAKGVSEWYPAMDRDVLGAIERHTTGHPRMNDLDRVVYLADMIEPGRDFPGVDDLREAAGNMSLDDLFALAYVHSVRHLVEDRRPIHSVTVDVWNACIARRSA